MNKIYKFLGLAMVILYLAGCNDEDPKLPLPTIDFSTDPAILEVGKPVKFNNLTTNASSYQWNFGDGQTSTQVSPTITYDESGTYTVTLTAFTDDNQSDSVSQNLTVGERVMTGISINSIPFINLDGEDWDDPAGKPDSTKYPDFILVLGPKDDPSRIIATPPIVDLAPFELPVGFNINPDGDPYVLTNETWELTFIDSDGEDPANPSGDGDLEFMNVITFNPVTIPTGTVTETGEGFVQISIGTYSVDLYFQVE